MTRVVYVLEADHRVRASLQCLLGLHTGQDVAGFARGEDFLERAATLSPGLVLVDLDMDERQGIELLASLDRLYKGKFAAVVLTDGASRALAIRALQAGAVEVIEKPYRPADLLDTLDSAFACLETREDAAPPFVLAREKLGCLSGRERDVMAGLVDGHSNRAIARAFDLNVRSVEIYRSKLLAKLGARNVSAVIRIAFEAGMIS